MRSRFVATATLLIIAFVFDVITVHSDDVQQYCSKGKFYNEDTEQCESCAKCKLAQFESRKCTPYQDTICSWCGAANVKKNTDYYVKCVLKRDRNPTDGKIYLKKPGTKVVDSIHEVDDKKVSDEVIDVEELPDRRTLPPLPTDDDYDDQEYDDNDILDTIKLDVPASEEELIGKDILLRDDLRLQPLDNKHQNEKRFKVEKELELEEDKVQPVNVNEGTIGQDDDFAKDDNELLHHNERISIVAIAFRKKQSSQANTVDDGVFSSTYTSICHTMGIYLYLASFVILLGILLKRCCRTSDRVPRMDFTEDQRAMITRCARNLKNKGKGKEEAFYDNDIAQV
ncbi:hypothetical protein KIN20_013876 [Parelaphostrongylus tenuis]|uniref:TNFR-Cys domain-containing protein n=1 Tax=Parelaphostrongylus tenuis TaxID=148309 RepID=A0AAD5MY45_PARTN|nr:hypothetical protein KIN20_013876 [Parelaphostrongylus tenuis]